MQTTSLTKAMVLPLEMAEIKKDENQKDDARRRRILAAVENVANQMLTKHADEIERGEITVDLIVRIGNKYVQNLLK